MYNLRNVRPHVWHLEMSNHYELAMTFLRAQEFYESPQFRGKFFSLVDFMDWYTQEFSQMLSFTYADDWSGFNVPSHVLNLLYPVYEKRREYSKIPDFNKYDERMYSILSLIREHEGEANFYLIGTLEESEGTFGHELAHAYWTTDGVYHNKMRSTMYGEGSFDKARLDRARGLIKKILLEKGYDETVLDDETQAYCATGFSSELVPLLEDPDVMLLVQVIGQVFAEQEKKYA